MPAEQITSNTASVDLSLWIAIAALVLSTLSPILSSLINGYFRIKEKKLESSQALAKHQQEFYERHRAEVIERYLTAVGKAAKVSTTANHEMFGEVMGEIYLYVDESLWPLLDSIAGKITKHNLSDPTDELQILCKALSANGVRSKD